MTMMASHPIGTVRPVSWPMKARPSGGRVIGRTPVRIVHHVPGQQGPTLEHVSMAEEALHHGIQGTVIAIGEIYRG